MDRGHFYVQTAALALHCHALEVTVDTQPVAGPPGPPLTAFQGDTG